jgi:hypothetical protein
MDFRQRAPHLDPVQLLRCQGTLLLDVLVSAFVAFAMPFARSASRTNKWSMLDGIGA